MPVSTALADPLHCPLCHQPNGCAMAQARSTGLAPTPCWCMALDIPPARLAAVPAPARHRACICAACAAPTA